jgi:hypothetical protein
MSHAGINITHELARKHYFWPSLSTDIAAMINNWDKCQLLRPSQAAEPLQCQPKPVEPMQSVSMDLYEVRGRHFLVMCGRFSYFCWAAPLNTLKSSTVIRIIDTWFHGVGFPQYIYLDSGPQFNAAEFKDYCGKHFITPLVRSACFPQSNGVRTSHIPNRCPQARRPGTACCSSPPLARPAFCQPTALGSVLAAHKTRR